MATNNESKTIPLIPHNNESGEQGSGSAEDQLAQTYINNNNYTASNKRAVSLSSDEGGDWVRKRARRNNTSANTAQGIRETVVLSGDEDENDSDSDSMGSASMDISSDEMPESGDEHDDKHDDEHDDSAGGSSGGAAASKDEDSANERYDAEKKSRDDDNRFEGPDDEVDWGDDELDEDDYQQQLPQNYSRQAMFLGQIIAVRSPTPESSSPPFIRRFKKAHRALPPLTRTSPFNVYDSESSLSSLGSSPSPPSSPTFARLNRELSYGPPCTCTGWCTCTKYKAFYAGHYPGDGILIEEEAQEAGVLFPSQVHLSNRVLDAEEFVVSGMRETLHGKPGPLGRVPSGTVKEVWSWELGEQPARAPRSWVGGEWIGGERVVQSIEE